MIKLKRIPSHPGQILKEGFLDELNISQTELASALGTTFRTINEIVDEKKAPTQPIKKTVVPESTVERKVEFITFGNDKQDFKSERTNSTPEPQQKNNQRMNRKEAIGFAKKMLQAGASHEKIKKIIPVSESELALLSLNIN